MDKCSVCKTYNCYNGSAFHNICIEHDYCSYKEDKGAILSVGFSIEELKYLQEFLDSEHNRQLMNQRIHKIPIEEKLVSVILKIKKTLKGE